jgi:flavin reductase (DIM6/NTAB) family NADH-FMN oxidoreductase RutF
MSQQGSFAAETAREIDPREFRDTMGAFVTGVTVVTTAFANEVYGMTVSAFSSLSLEPLLALVCLANGSRGRQLIERSTVFSVNVLAADQAHLSRFFASRERPSGPDAFAGAPFTWGVTGCPVLRGAAAHVDCTVVEITEAGDHSIVIGQVVGLGSRPDAAPLLFHRGHYRLLAHGDAASL